MKLNIKSKFLYRNKKAKKENLRRCKHEIEYKFKTLKTYHRRRPRKIKQEISANKIKK
jgi:hypothetical protein